MAHAVKTLKILVVDDETEFCSLLKEFLEGEGYTVDVAYNGADGIKKACFFEPDVILLDIRMPKINGIEMLKKIKGCSSAPIIIVTGISDIKIAEECIKLGAHSYIRKPISLEKLEAELKELLGNN